MTEIEDITVDTGEIDAALDKVKDKSSLTLSKITSEIRRAWDTTIIFSYLAGETIGQAYELMAQAVFIGAETLTALAQAQTLSVLGAVQGVITFGLAIALYAKGLMIRYRGEQTSREFDRVIMLLNVWRMYGITMIILGVYSLWQMKLSS